ncbi:MAG: hypothetical protein ACI9VR_004842 [Cognaticolwellia sp.]|jgi:hypothetical protein
MTELPPPDRDPRPSSGIQDPMAEPLRKLPPLDDGELDIESLLERVQEETAQTGVRAQIQSLPSMWRVVAALCLMGLISAAMFLIAGVRSDFDESFAALAVPLIFCGVAAGGAVVLALRGPHKAPMRGSNWILAGVLLVPVILSVLPQPGVDTHGALPPILGCLTMGSIAAFATAGGVLLFSRWIRQDRGTLALAAGAGGLVGFILQQLHCMAGDPIHLLASHGLLGLLVAGFFVGGSLLRR